TGKALTDLMKHDSPVNSAQFSPDGRRIVTASGDRLRSTASNRAPGYAQVWDADTGKPVTEPMKHDNVVYAAQFSPDGKRIVTAPGDIVNWQSTKSAPRPQVWDQSTGETKTWDAKTGKTLVWDSITGKVVFRDSTIGKALVWDAQTGKPLKDSTGKELTMKHNGAVVSAQFSPDGKRIVTASWDHTARVWDAKTGEPLNDQTGKEVTMRHDRYVVAKNLRLSREGTGIATA